MTRVACPQRRRRMRGDCATLRTTLWLGISEGHVQALASNVGSEARAGGNDRRITRLRVTHSCVIPQPEYLQGNDWRKLVLKELLADESFCTYGLGSILPI